MGIVDGTNLSRIWGKVKGLVSTHNTDSSSHSDIREDINDMSTNVQQSMETIFGSIQYVTEAVNSKQDKLTAGNGISIAANNTISIDEDVLNSYIDNKILGGKW